jgi:hypothetical protein
MNPVARLSAKALIWLLAAIVPAQPVLSLDCACHCRPHAECSDDQCQRHDGHAHAHGHCHAGHEQDGAHSTCEEPCVEEQSTTSWGLIWIGIRPCQCPSDCDCQLGHEVRAGIVSSSEDQPRVSSAVAFHFGHAPDGARESTVPATFLFVRHTAHERTALEICAHLCRFTA